MQPECPATGQLDQGLSVVYLGPTAVAQSVLKLHVALNAYAAALAQLESS